MKTKMALTELIREDQEYNIVNGIPSVTEPLVESISDLCKLLPQCIVLFLAMLFTGEFIITFLLGEKRMLSEIND